MLIVLCYRWILQVLILLQNYRHDLWMLRNASLHGGFDKLHGKLLRARLLKEIKYLYARNRNCLTLSDQEMFKLPFTYRKKQGNQQLMLWVKRATMMFDSVEESNAPQQQLSITDWLTNWDNDPPLPSHESRTVKKTSDRFLQRQTDITEWINSWGGQSNILDHSPDSLDDSPPYGRLNVDDEDGCSIEENRVIVTDGTHQYNTTNTCILVR